MDSEQFLLLPKQQQLDKGLIESIIKDYNFNDKNLIYTIISIRNKLLKLVNQNSENSLYESVLISGPGIYGIESVLTSTQTKKDKLLVIVNGKMAERIVYICNRITIEYDIIKLDENEEIDIDKIIKKLEKDKKITYVICVHIEQNGIMNDIQNLGIKINKSFPNITYIVDCISSLGSYPIDIEKSNIDFLISSSNKSIESLSGLAIIICNRNKLLKAKWSKSLSLDLLSNWNSLVTFGKFRFSPPVHVILGLNYSLKLLFKQGGIEHRLQKYQSIQEKISNYFKLYGKNNYIERSDSPYLSLFQINNDNLKKKLEEKEFLYYKIKNIYPYNIYIPIIGIKDDNEFIIFLNKIKYLFEKN